MQSNGRRLHVGLLRSGIHICDLFGGPSKTEESLSSQETNLSGSLNAAYQTAYGQQQNTLQSLQSEVSQIQSGNTGPGFGAAELAAKTGQIVNGAAAGARNAQQAAQNQGAGQTFGNDSSGLQSGIRKQINGEIASGAETNENNALTNLTTQNYNQGRANAQATASGLSTLAGIENPLGYAGAASGANNQAFGQANTINQQEIARSQAIASFAGDAIGTVAGGVLGGIGNLDTTGSSTGSEQAQNFFNGFSSASGGGG